MKRLLAIILLATAFLFGGCTPAPPPSPLSQETQASLEILIDQLQLDEFSAIDILARLRHAGLDQPVRMAFATEEQNTYRVWLQSAALDVTLDENGMVASIRDGKKELYAAEPQGSKDTSNIPQSPDEPVENPVDSVENLDKSDNLPVENPSADTLRLISLTSPIEAGKQATLTACGLPGAEYDISVRYASGESTAQGLAPQRADENGRLEWTFRVSSRVAAGEYPVTVSGNGETLTLTLTVVAP